MNGSTDRSVMLRRFQQTIRTRKGIVGGGDGFTVALHTNGRLLYIGTSRRGQAPDASVDHILSVHATGDSLLALRSDGTVFVAGRSEAEAAFAAGMTCVRRAALGAHHMALLPGNGRVQIGGVCPRGHGEIALWPSVADVACGTDFTAGLCEDGRVLLAGGSHLMRHTVAAWPRMAGIFADVEGNALYGITATGRLVGTTALPVKTREWRNLVFFAASGRRLCAVTASGKLISTHRLPASMTEGRAFVACAVGTTHTVAVTRDGRVAAAGDDRFGQCRTAAMGNLFSQFEEFTVRRREREIELDRIERAYQLRHAEAARFGSYLSCGERLTACLTAYGRVLMSSGIAGGKVRDHIHRLSCGNAHILALCKSGRVLADGNPVGKATENCCDVESWQDVRAIAAGSYHSLGVTYSGSVYFCGSNAYGQGDVTDWRDIRLVRTTDTYTVGLTYDGRLRVAGLAPFDRFLLDGIDGRVVDMAVTSTHILCLLADGRAFATLPPTAEAGHVVADPTVAAWHNVRAIAAAPGISVGLCYGGTVRAVGFDEAMCRALGAWRGIVAIGCGVGYVAGLGADGRMHVVGTPTLARESHTDFVRPENDLPPAIPTSFGETASGWQDIIAFACGPSHLVALNRDGQVFACGSDSDGQCSGTAHFTLFRDARALAGHGWYRRDADAAEPASAE